jgi:hypothetical protein
VAAEKDDPGVLGNLPRSRPGRRSDKRASGGAGARKQPAAGGTAKRGGTQARATATSQRAKRSSGTKSAARKTTPKTTAPKTSTPPRRPTQPRDTGGGGDPLSQAVRLGGKVAETGVKTAVGILKRLSGR